MHLPDIVQESTGEHQVAVEVRIMAAGQIAQIQQRYHVLKQAPDISMVQGFGRWRVAKSCGEGGVLQEGL